MLTKETAQKVLDSQLGGIMFHTDMVNMFTVLGNRKMAEYQERQLDEEMHTFLNTKRYVYGLLGELILPTQKSGARLAVPVKVSCDKECYELRCKAMATWKDWEEGVKALYETALEEDNTAFFERLLCGVRREIAKIKKMMELR